MSVAENCQVCGKKRPVDGPAGLCPACLLKAGLAAKDSKLDDVTFLFGPASSSIVAAFGEAFGKMPRVLLRDADSLIDPGPVIRPSSDEIPNPAERSARLQLFGEIARGGMGAVLKGRDADLGRELAVKILLESHRDKPEMVRRFIEEAQIAGQLQHPGIVPVYELGAFGDHRPYFAMKLVKGQTLAEILANRKSLSDGLPKLLSIFESICQTMAYAHARGVIHRDLKPSNVMVGSFGEVQVMDWGLAKVLPRGGVVDDASAGHTKEQATLISTARSGTDSDLSQAGSVMGTPAYMAPEQARGEVEEVDERADVFALGSIFCELLTGQPAFSGRNSGEILRKAARGDLMEAVARLDRSDLGHDPELVALAKSCLSSERDDRPRHAGEIAERMSLYHSRVQDRLRQSEVERAEQKARAEEATKRATVERQRLRLTVALAASIIGFAILGGGGWAYLAQQRSARLAATELAVNDSLSKATLLHGQAKAAPVGDLGKWTEALAAAKQAEASLQTGEPSNVLGQRIADLIQTLEVERKDAEQKASEAERDRRLFARIEAIRVDFVDADEVWYYGRESKSPGLADAAYAAAFREFGVDVDQLEPAEAGKLLQQRPEALEIAFAIDAWALIRKDLARDEQTDKQDPHKDLLYRRLVELACHIDPDPFRCSIRKHEGVIDQYFELIKSPAGQELNEKASLLVKVMNDAELAKQPARALYVIGLKIEHSRQSWFGKPQNHDRLTATIALWKRAWQLRPSDFQLCWTLAKGCRDDVEKRAFAMAAVAAAPESPFAKEWSKTADESTDYFPILDQTVLVKSGDEAPAWTFPHLVIESSLGEKFFLGPTRYPALTAEEKTRQEREVQELRWAIRLQPKVTALQTKLGTRLVRLGRFDEALAVYEAKNKLHGKLDPEETIAWELYGMGQVDKAKELLEAMIRQSEKSFLNEAYALLGVIHTEQGRRDLAFECFRDGYIRIYEQEDGNSIMTALEGGWDDAMQCSGTLEQVVAAYQSWIGNENCSSPSSLSKELGAYLVKHGKTEEALNVYREALTRKGGDNVLYELSRLLVQLNCPDEAIDVYKHAIARKPEDIDLRDSLASLYGDVGKPDEQLAVLRELVPLYQERIRGGNYSYQSLARLYRKLGQIEDARAIERERLKNARTGSSMLFNSDAMMYATSDDPNFRDPDMAIEFAKRACEMTQYSQSMILDTLATAYAAKGDFDSAVMWQLKAIELCDDESMEFYEENLKLFRERKTVPP
jgi:serine/threonine protein kinase/tetratricopeptide (TPR) repeat protein